MTVYPYQRPQFGELVPEPLGWAKRVRAEQQVKRMAAAEERAAHRLGSDWHVLDRPTAPAAVDAPVSRKTPPLTGFLAIGPGGIFSISIAQHGRNRVMVAGDIVQIDGRRPSYVNDARRDARKVAKAISAVVGQEIKVFPVLAFVGSGMISVNGLPKDCVVTSYRELDKVLASTGKRISAMTAEKLSQVARNPLTWSVEPTGYRWYDGPTPGDKGTTRG
jgi:hypothetical protein